MPEIHDTVLILVKPEAVWEVLVDPYYAPKLYPDVLNITVEPPGRSVVGQKRTSDFRVGKRVVHFYTQVIELNPTKRFALTGLRFGAFEEFSQIVELAPAEGGTQVRVVFSFKVSEDNFGPEFNLMDITASVAANQASYLKRLKELSELQPVA
jgi:hypothetical protein